MHKIDLKPVSVNECYTGRRHKTAVYRQFALGMSVLLPKLENDFKGSLRVNLIFGFSSRGSDLDNCVKTTLDCLQSKYGFNDNQIFEMLTKKVIVPKGEEYIKYEIIELR